MVAALFAAAFSLTAFAQTQPPPTPTPAALEGFVPMSQAAPREELPATPMVFYAYAFVWVALIVYVFSIWRRMTRVEQDLAAVRRRLQDSAGGR
jgi:CcmD family protein